jgi:hypothetical protein
MCESSRDERLRFQSSEPVRASRIRRQPRARCDEFARPAPPFELARQRDTTSKRIQWPHSRNRRSRCLHQRTPGHRQPTAVRRFPRRTGFRRPISISTAAHWYRSVRRQPWAETVSCRGRCPSRSKMRRRPPRSSADLTCSDWPCARPRPRPCCPVDGLQKIPRSCAFGRR